MRIRGNRRLVIFTMILLAVWLIAIPIREIGKECFKYYSLEKAGIETKARVLSLEPKNHQTVLYSYKVQSIEYRGAGRADFGNPGFNFITPSMELRAFYLPASPAISCLGLPHELFMNDLIPFSLFLVFIIILGGIQCRRWMKPPPRDNEAYNGSH